MPRIVLLALVAFATIYALVDCIQTDSRLVRIMPKPVWLLVVLIPVLGPIFWLVTGRVDARGGRGLSRGGTSRRGPSRPTGPRGPDDDPDFLRKLRPPKP